MSMPEELKKIIRQLRKKVRRLEDENLILKEQHHAELQEWQATCSSLHDELLEAVSGGSKCIKSFA